MSTLCMCYSGKMYKACCKPFHHGTLPHDALELMHSRYAAYALHRADYIIDTTHPNHPHFQQDLAKWKHEILTFCQNTQFKGLKIIEFVNGQTVASVTFLASLIQQGHDVSFIEKSLFEKIHGKWLYKSGTLSPIFK